MHLVWPAVAALGNVMRNAGNDDAGQMGDRWEPRLIQCTVTIIRVPPPLDLMTVDQHRRA